MDQSLRTVATQLMNSTKHEDLARIADEEIVKIETPMQVVHISTRVQDAINDENNNNNEDDSSNMKYGIPINSKFSPFEITNPGHAMAMTDEEIEKEMATATIIVDKKQPTTPSLLSTWIQLYPLSTTTEGNNASPMKFDIQSNQISTISSKSTLSNIKQNTKPIRKTEPKSTTISIEKTTESSIFTKISKNTNFSSTPNFVKISTTLSTTSIENDDEEIETTVIKDQSSTPILSTTKSSTKKSTNKNSTTPKVKLSTSKNSTNKTPKPISSPNRIKPFSTRKPVLGNKNDNVTSTSKIEKVTFKPFSTFSQNLTERTDKPIFITKLKTSLLSDNNDKSTTTPASLTNKFANSILLKSNFSHIENVNTKVPNPTRVNNDLKVHNVKRPSDNATKNEILPIWVNPPTFTIEKIGDTSSDQKTKDVNNQSLTKNSKNNVKLNSDINVAKIKVQTQSPDDYTSFPSTSTSTTKKPRLTNKRKKNKNRRRKTTTTSTTFATTDIPSENESQTINESTSIDGLQVTGIQESKIEPESKAPPSKKKKQSQQTQVQKPIGTQIYNFISREVMPSVGVMSLVGLGLGLASYFLYPFGGVVTRRNYDVEPNYKYNIDEYGGNYGLSEEEVLSKVYSGMTGGQQQHYNQDPKYQKTKKNPNYYRYEQVSHHSSTRHPSSSVKNPGNRVIYKPIETNSNRNTEFKYPEIQTTPIYYDRQKLHHRADDFLPTISKLGIGNNRQFVVGNVPKEYSSEEVDKLTPDLTIQDKAVQKLQYETNENDNLPAASSASSSFLTAPTENKNLADSSMTLNLKADEEQHSDSVFEDLKMTQEGDSVIVEHGPRSLSTDDATKIDSTSFKVIRQKRGILPDLATSFIPMIKGFETPRKERNSVIQVIPTKSEIEKEKKEEEAEEDLSNEILDIIDDALPGTKNGNKDHTKTANKQNTKTPIVKVTPASSNKHDTTTVSTKSTITLR